ncbi:hypothetical protein KQX54_017415 [Cotesia glomerata]|uniref:Uncharacterized protein n=1 Tax=Cotesia glomerata TaxID=32391 RepID=A0AAV7II60_COTGL|nr:hypothetical protein KQX54_017415 [Cotesia glomerata]
MSIQTDASACIRNALCPGYERGSGKCVRRVHLHSRASQIPRVSGGKKRVREWSRGKKTGHSQGERSLKANIAVGREQEVYPSFSMLELAGLCSSIIARLLVIANSRDEWSRGLSCDTKSGSSASLVCCFGTEKGSTKRDRKLESEMKRMRVNCY